MGCGVFSEISAEVVLLIVLAILATIFLGVNYYTGGTLIASVKDIAIKSVKSIFKENNLETQNVATKTVNIREKLYTNRETEITFGTYKIIISKPYSTVTINGETRTISREEFNVTVTVSNGVDSKDININLLVENIVFIVEDGTSFNLTKTIPKSDSNYYILKFDVCDDCITIRSSKYVATENPYGEVVLH